jgi:hypothetical protein
VIEAAPEIEAATEDEDHVIDQEEADRENHKLDRDQETENQEKEYHVIEDPDQTIEEDHMITQEEKDLYPETSHDPSRKRDQGTELRKRDVLAIRPGRDRENEEEKTIRAKKIKEKRKKNRETIMHTTKEKIKNE